MTRGLEVRGEGGEAVAIVAVADVGEVGAGVGVSPGILAARHGESGAGVHRAVIRKVLFPICHSEHSSLVGSNFSNWSVGSFLNKI